MKVKLLRDVTTPEPWVPDSLKTWYKKGTEVRVTPADNIPQDGDDPIRFWVDEPEVEDDCYGIGLHDGDFVLVDEEVDTEKDVFNNTYILWDRDNAIHFRIWQENGEMIFGDWKAFGEVEFTVPAYVNMVPEVVMAQAKKIMEGWCHNTKQEPVALPDGWYVSADEVFE